MKDIQNSKMIEQLERLFNRLNKDIFENELPCPIITIQSRGKRKGVLGWFTTWKAWDNGQGGRYEINIVAESLNRPYKEIAETMLHEMVHLFCEVNEIQDCSRGGTYHNNKFKEVAEKHFLIVEKSSKYGWAHTKGNEEFEKLFSKYYQYEFCYRLEKENKDKGKEKPKSYKHTCEHCGAIARTTKVMTLICGECKETMTIE